MPLNIRNYEVFQLSHKMVLKIYTITKNFPQEEKYGSTSQLRRSAYSIAMNLIEGGVKLSENEFRRFVDISIGSCAEVEYQIELCHTLNYLHDVEFNDVLENYQRIGKMLNRLMQKLHEKKAKSEKPGASKAPGLILDYFKFGFTNENIRAGEFVNLKS